MNKKIKNATYKIKLINENFTYKKLQFIYIKTIFSKIEKRFILNINKKFTEQKEIIYKGLKRELLNITKYKSKRTLIQNKQ